MNPIELTLCCVGAVFILVFTLIGIGEVFSGYANRKSR